MGLQHRTTLMLVGARAVTDRTTILEEGPWYAREVISEAEYEVRKMEETLLAGLRELAYTKKELNKLKRELIRGPRQ